MVLRLNQCVLGIREVLKGGTGPISVVSSDIQHMSGGKPETLQEGKKNSSAIGLGGWIFNARHAKAEKSKQGLDCRFQGQVVILE